MIHLRQIIVSQGGKHPIGYYLLRRLAYGRKAANLLAISNNNKKIILHFSTPKLESTTKLTIGTPTLPVVSPKFRRLYLGIFEVGGGGSGGESGQK